MALRFEDQAMSPTSTINVADAGFEIRDLLLDPSTSAQQAKPGTLRGWLSVPGVIGDAKIDGTFTPGSSSLIADMQMSVSNASAQSLKPYLANFGVEPILHDGHAQAHAKITLSELQNGVGGSLSLDQVRVTDGDQELAALDGFQLNDVALIPGQLSIASIQIDKPRAAVSRDAKGLFAAGGIKILPPATQPIGAVAPPAATRPAATRPADSQPVTPFVVAAQASFASMKLSLNWADQFVPGSANLTATVSAQLDDLTLGRDSAPAPFKLALTVPGTLQKLDVAGTVKAAPTTQAIEMQVSGEGVRAGSLAPYLSRRASKSRFRMADFVPAFPRWWRLIRVVADTAPT